MLGQDTVTTNYADMNIAQLARVIRLDWGHKVNFGAVPYLAAMFTLYTLDDEYGCDSGSSIVAYFLGNAATWRGPVSKAVKLELNRRLKACR